jgi:hypothetical protein
VSTSVTAALEDGIGVIVLLNADDESQQPAIYNITLLALAKAFGLEATSGSSPANTSTFSSSNQQRRASISALQSRASSSPYLDLAGTYYNAGYGTWVLCSVHSTSSSCQSLLDDFRSVDNSISPNSSDLFVSWETVISSQLRFTYTNDSQFTLSGGTIYPEGYGKDSTPFAQFIPMGQATFVVEDATIAGFGISGISGVERKGPVEKASDVWFVKQG